MKRILLLLTVVTTCFFVSCSKDVNEKDGAGSEPVEQEINWLALEELEFVESFLAEEKIELEEGYVASYFNVIPNEVAELFILPATAGKVHILTLDENGQYKIVESTLQASSESVITYEKDLIFVNSPFETNEKSGRSTYIYKLLDDQIRSVLNSPFVTEESRIVDFDLNCLETTTTTFEYINDEGDFDILLKSQYVDEFKNTYSYKNIKYSYTFIASSNEFTATKTDKSEFKSLQKLRAGIVSYGTDDTLLTFDDVYETDGLEGAINYYSDNRQNFVEGAKEDFADSVALTLNDGIRYFNFYAKNMFDYALVTENNEISFPRKDGQVEAEIQSVFGYFKAYIVKNGVVEEDGYKVMIKNHDLSRKIYALSADLSKRSNIKSALNYRIHSDAGEVTGINKPTRIITEDELELTHENSTLLIPLVLTDEPVEWVDARNVSGGETINDIKVSLKKVDDEHFTFTFRVDQKVEGIIYKDSQFDILFIEIISPGIGHCKYPFDGKAFRMDMFTGIHSIQDYNIEETIGKDILRQIKSGEKVKVEGEINTLAYSGYKDTLDINDYPSIWFKNMSLIEE